MEFSQAVAALDARTNYEASGALLQPTLERARALAELLDHPQHSFPSIHVTGTNGKGTTVAVATALLRALGLGVGSYTSPHLHSVCERIAYDLASIPQQDFADTYAYLEPFLKEVDSAGSAVTWFEAITAMSWVYFAERAVDAAVIEVGMGGSWDATNLIDGRVAVVSSVALDHRELGATVEDVATDKSGIVKHGAVCVTGERDPGVLEVLRKRCAKEGATLRRAGAELSVDRRAPGVGGQELDVRVGDHVYTELFLPLYGQALADDAAVGLAAVEAFLGDRPIDDDIVRAAFAAVKSPGRIEVLSRQPLVVTDGAHNPAATAALAAALQESFRWDDLHLVIGMLGSHFRPGVLEPLLAMAHEVIVTQPDSPRAMPARALADEIAALGTTARVQERVEDALALAIDHVSGGGAVLATGSLYTVATVRRQMLEGRKHT